MTGKYAHHAPFKCALYWVAHCIIRPSVAVFVVAGPSPIIESCASARIPEEIWRMKAITT